MRAGRTDLRALLEPGVRAAGFELVHVELAGGGGHRILRVYIDGPAGVGVDDCATVSRQLSALLDVEDPVPGQYLLEVSSPGLDRPLVGPDDFRRFAGQQAKLRAAQPVAGRRNFTGRIAGVEHGHVVLETGEGRVELALEQIESARLVPQLRTGR